MELVIVIAAVAAGGILMGAAALAWPLHVKPMLRRRYERNHHRSKAKGSNHR